MNAVPEDIPGNLMPEPALSLEPKSRAMALMGVVSTIGGWMARVEQALAGALLAASVLITLYTIFARAVGISVGAWAQMAIQYAVIWAVFLGIGAVLRGGHHVRMVLLVDSLFAAQFRRAIELVISLIGLAACVVVAVAGFQNVSSLTATKMADPEFFDLPFYPILAIVPIGMSILGFHFVERICLLLSSPNVTVDVPHQEGRL